MANEKVKECLSLMITTEDLKKTLVATQHELQKRINDLTPMEYRRFVKLSGYVSTLNNEEEQ